MNTPPGMVLGMPAEVYHGSPALGSGGLRDLARSPWHFHNRVPVIPTRPMLRGTLAHCAVLEPDAMASRYVVVPEDAPRRPTAAQWNAKKSNEDSMAAKAWWTEFAALCSGKEIVPANDYAITKLQLEALKAEETLAEYLSIGWGEVSIFWRDKETGVECKARPDWVHPLNDREVVLLDLKTTADESPDGFGRTAARMKYHLQDAHYTEGFERATRLKVALFIFAAVTSAAPVLAVPYQLTDQMREQGRDERRELLERLAWCRANDAWPSYGSGIQLLDFPAYAKRNSEVEVAFADD